MSARSTRHLALRFCAVFLTALSLVDLLSMLLVVVLHASLPTSVGAGVLAPMTYILAGASASGMAAALAYGLLAHPEYRKALLVLSLIVLCLLGAHLYTLDLPPLGTTSTLSAQVGTAAKDSYVSLSSTLTGSTLNVFVTDTGTYAVGTISVAVGNTALPDSGLTSRPNATSALEPGGVVSGTWTLAGPPSGPVRLTYQHLVCYDISKAVDGCVMDEVYYVPAAQAMLSGEKCAPYADNCNMEHPFLSKAFIAAGIAIFGNDAFGWRIFEALLGTFSVPVLFGICLAITRNQRLSLYAAFLLAFETLYFVHSSIAVIDISSMFFGLLAFFFYFAKVRWWKLDTIALTAAALGLSALSKETAIMFLLVLLVYHLLFGEGTRVRRVLSSAELTLSVFLVFALGLQVYDSLLGSGTATNFLGQMAFILKYGASLTLTPTSRGWIDPLLGTPITPWNWVTYYSPVSYDVIKVTVTAGARAYSYVSAGYYGILDQFEVWFAYAWGAYAVYLWRKTGGRVFPSEVEARDFRVARLALVWVLLIFFAYLALFYYGRITYPYYFLQAVPALAAGMAYLLTRPWFPREVAYILLGGVLLWFFIFYPDKSFLPIQLRVWLGH